MIGVRKEGILQVSGGDGEPGPIGSTGPQGEQGLSAYEVAITEGFIGTEEEWLTSLIGANGIQGIQGIPGNNGNQGIQGIQGIQGEQGNPGVNTWGSVTGTLSNQTDLQTALNTKAATSHTHPQSEVTSLVSDLTLKAPLASPAFSGTPTGITKTHVGLGNVDNTSDANKPISSATQTALDGKSATGHTHTGVYEPANANIQAHVISAHAPSDAQKNSNILKAEIEAVLTGAITSHSHAGGGSVSATRVIATASFPALKNKKINIIDAAVTASNKILAWISGIADGLPNSGDLVNVYNVRAVAKTGSFDLDLNFLTPWAGSISIDYMVIS